MRNLTRVLAARTRDAAALGQTVAVVTATTGGPPAVKATVTYLGRPVTDVPVLPGVSIAVGDRVIVSRLSNELFVTHKLA